MAIRRSAAERHGRPSVVQLRLAPTPAQANALATAVRVCNQAATYTSQACPECGWTSRANRPARGRFACTRCGLAGHADRIAARNIAQRGVAGWAAVNQPHATGLPSARRDRESKPPACELLLGGIGSSSPLADESRREPGDRDASLSKTWTTVSKALNRACL
ncbi:zinc ribbon domain-containing protein [Nonomuraea sp. JJY05]|uniref:zinc ribbon domain-containing protein n=1 Tax=Nonomuraea sp. JJY05 TaxID=3350255 RepID=UPI00373F4771